MYSFTTDRDMFPNCLGPDDWPVIATNTQGIMGAGQAGAYAQWDARGYEHYKRRCKAGEHRTGQVMLVRGNHGIAVCLATMERPGTKLKNGLVIAHALCHLYTQLDQHEITGIRLHVPRLGCGIGGLQWDRVRDAIVSAAWLDKHNEWIIYGPER